MHASGAVRSRSKPAHVRLDVAILAGSDSPNEFLIRTAIKIVVIVRMVPEWPAWGSLPPNSCETFSGT